MMNKFSLANPRTKIPLSKLFVLFPVVQNITQTDTSTYGIWDLIQGRNEISVGFKRTIAVCNVVNDNSEENLKANQYFDLFNLEPINVKEGITSSYEFEETDNSFNRMGKEKYGLPIRFDEFIKNYDIVLKKDKIKISDACKIIEEINKKDQDKEMVTLSFDRDEAKKQINKILGRGNYSHIDDDIDMLISKIQSLCKNNEHFYGSYVEEKLNYYVESYRKRLEEEKPTYKRFNHGEITDLNSTKPSPNQELFLNLQKLYLNLSEEISLMNYSNDLSYAMKLLQGDNSIQNEGNENESSFIQNIRSILSDIEYLPNEKDKIILDLTTKIEKERKAVNDEIDLRVKSHEKDGKIKSLDAMDYTLRDEIKLVRDDTSKKADSYRSVVDFSKLLKSTVNGEYKELIGQDISTGSLLNQINNSIIIVRGYKSSLSKISDEVFEEHKRELITNSVIEVLNSINPQSMEDYPKIINDLENALGENKNKLKDKKIDNYEDYKEAYLSIITDIAGIKLDSLGYEKETFNNGKK